ncbi:MAG: bifunctional UDP-N-acetylglucosamine diphosphorylase/glucosamine-1-phosphate N-acetyltransferase GlmU [Zoogloeaceae bacterium]|nr:bifunctional UDP-N-acetylglucosamine diphosphorylase/glucosamine-1-phosphate N-acetyltransferase GlmU [Zoogloeaceae bacterium]
MNIVVLAAGQGKRMNSRLPKVLQPLAGKPLLRHVLETARKLNPKRLVVVYGHGGEVVRETLDDTDLVWALQAEQLGTGHALRQALPFLEPVLSTLVLYGDVPLVRPETLAALMVAASADGLGILTAQLANPKGYGRVLRDARGAVRAIVEEKDASPEERRVTEINTGILLLPTASLPRWLENLSSANAQGEYYLTDVVVQAVEEGIPVRAVEAACQWETEGVNDRLQLARLERLWQREEATRLLRQGVRLTDPERLDVRGALTCGRDVFIDAGCVFTGEVTLEDSVEIGPYCVIGNARIRTGAKLAAYTHVEGAEIGAGAVVGPYARLRPGTILSEAAHVGNFVEIKNSHIGAGSKANHLAYVGDADLGARVNVGAGVITCNYDGANKWRTVIEDDVFIGSDTQLVAPVHVGKGATLGAGTTLTKDAPAEALTVSRARQTSFAGWKRPEKHKG